MAKKIKFIFLVIVSLLLVQVLMITGFPITTFEEIFLCQDKEDQNFFWDMDQRSITMPASPCRYLWQKQTVI